MQPVSNEPIDPRWPKLLSLTVHELRTPITVVSGYLRMVLKERAGPISDQQRKLLEEAEKSCGRLSGLVAELSDLASLEGGTAVINRGTLDLVALLRTQAEQLAELPDRSVTTVVEADVQPVNVSGDATRLGAAFASLLAALRREVVQSDRLVARVRVAGNEAAIAIADATLIDALSTADVSTLERFDEWRGGSGLTLAIARRVIGQHGGSLLAPAGGEKTAAVVFLPLAV
jgi:signal transduction histidine kinase